MKSYDVVGYTYQAELVCRPCMRSIAANQIEARGWNSEYVSLDRLMSTWATDIAGVDEGDESSFDSGDFPKVVFADQNQADDTCGRCGETLGWS